MLWKVPCWIAFTVRRHMRKYVAANPLLSETLEAESLRELRRGDWPARYACVISLRLDDG